MNDIAVEDAFLAPAPPEDLGFDADRLKAAVAFAEKHDGSQLAALDALIPGQVTGDVFEGG